MTDGFAAGDIRREFADALFHLRKIDLSKISGASVPLSPRELIVMQWLKNHVDSHLIIQKLASDMGVSRPLLSQILHTLKARGYIGICSSPSDRRRIMALVTNEGAYALREAHRCYDHAVDRLFTRSHMPIGEIVVLIRLINRLSVVYQQLKV